MKSLPPKAWSPGITSPESWLEIWALKVTLLAAFWRFGHLVPNVVTGRRRQKRGIGF